MKKTLINLLLALGAPALLFSQNCDQLWTKLKQIYPAEVELELLDAYIKQDCKDHLGEAFDRRGKVMYQLRDTIAANRDFKKAVAANPEFAEGWYRLAQTTFSINEADTSALTYVNRAIALNAQDACYAFMLRGDIALGSNDYKSALLDYESSIYLLNKSARPDLHALILSYTAAGGSLLDLSGEIFDPGKKRTMQERAVYYLRAAISADSTFEKAWFLLGIGQYYLKNYQQSVNAYERCAALNPKYPSVMEYTAISYRDLGKYTGEIKGDIPTAIKYLEKSYQINPNDFDTNRLLGVANGVSNKKKNAIKWFKQAALLKPNDPGIWWDLGTAYSINGDEKKSQECRDKALQIDPNYEKARSGH